MAKRELTPEQQLAQQIYSTLKPIYATLKPQTVGDVTEGLKKIFGPMIEAALQGELENHLGYDHHERTPESKGNSRNGYSRRARLKSKFPATATARSSRKSSRSTSATSPKSRTRSSPCTGAA